MDFDVALDQHHLEKLGAIAPIKGITELIWNALDADASEVRVEFGRNELDGIVEIRVIDDGHGMTEKAVVACSANSSPRRRRAIARAPGQARLGQAREHVRP